MRHAYLIIAHNEPEILRLLINSIDDSRNDIFLHIDSKSDFQAMSKNIKVRYSNIFYVKRNDVRWGDYSQVQTELDLFEYAYNQDNYRYFHLLSGVDLPIKSQDYIYNIFEQNDGKEFVTLYTPPSYETIEKILVYNFFTKNLRLPICRILRKLFCLIQRFLHIKRKACKLELKKGDNWLSVTNDFVQYLLSKKNLIRTYFKYTCCADEYFIQTFIYNSPFRENLFFGGDLRLINWPNYSTNSPEVFNSDDLKKIEQSDCIFARKFSSKNMDVVEKVLKEI